MIMCCVVYIFVVNGVKFDSFGVCFCFICDVKIDMFFGFVVVIVGVSDVCDCNCDICVRGCLCVFVYFFCDFFRNCVKGI